MGTLIYLNRIKNCNDRNTRVIIVQALALSIINYCSRIWGCANKTQIQRVQKLQNFAAKVALGKGKKYDRATPYINQLKWLKIEQKNNFDMCILMYKIVNHMIPNTLFPMITVGETHQMHTRQISNLYIPRTRTDMGKRQLLIRGPSLWNMLPNDIRESVGLYSFKHKLKEHCSLEH